MSSLGDKVYELITGGRPEPDPGSWQQLAADMVQRHGTVSGAARAAGIPRRTWRDWVTKLAAGKTVRPKATTLEKLVRAWQVQPPAESAVRLHTVDRADERPRVLDGISNLQLQPGTMRNAADVYVRTGDREAAARAFLEGVGEPFYVRYLTPRRDERATMPGTVPPSSGGSTGPTGGDEDDWGLAGDDEADEEADEAWDEWYEDLRGEEVDSGDSDTFSGGTVA